ncbi:MAG TPA: hypothetical protein VMT66_16870 [Steroidobacteraceae bacterium]|nr:hypothetical protein [Steroidobacteraceae bacterium]
MSEQPLAADQHGRPVENPAVLLKAGMALLAAALKVLPKAEPQQALAMYLADIASGVHDLAMQLAPPEFKEALGQKVRAHYLKFRPATYSARLVDDAGKPTGESVSFQVPFDEALERFGLPWQD